MLPRFHTGWLAPMLASVGFFCVLGLVQAQQQKKSPLNAGLKAGKQPGAAKAGKQKAALPKNAKAKKGRNAGAGPAGGLQGAILDVLGVLGQAVQQNQPRDKINHLESALHQLLLAMSGGHGWHHGHGHRHGHGHGHWMHARAKPAGHHEGRAALAGNGKRGGNGKGKSGSVKQAGHKKHGPGAKLGQAAIGRNAGKAKTNANPNHPARHAKGPGGVQGKGNAKKRSPFQGAIQSAVRLCVHVDVNVVVSRDKHRGNFKRGGQALAKGGQAGPTAKAKQVNAKANHSRGSAKNTGAKSAAHHCGVKNAGKGQANGQRVIANVRGAGQNTKKAGGPARNPGACLGQKAFAKAPGARKNGPTRNASLENRTKGGGVKAGNRPVGLVKCDGKFGPGRPGAGGGNKAIAKKGGAAKGAGQVAANNKLKNNGLRAPTQKGPARNAANAKGATQNLKAGRNQIAGMKKGNVQKTNFAVQKKSPQKANRIPASRPANLKQGFPRQFAPAHARAPQQQKMQRPQPMVAQRPVAFQRGMTQARTMGRRR